MMHLLQIVKHDFNIQFSKSELVKSSSLQSSLFHPQRIRRCSCKKHWAEDNLGHSNLADAYSEPSQTSKIGNFPKIFNC